MSQKARVSILFIDQIVFGESRFDLKKLSNKTYFISENENIVYCYLVEVTDLTGTDLDNTNLIRHLGGRPTVPVIFCTSNANQSTPLCEHISENPTIEEVADAYYKLLDAMTTCKTLQKQLTFLESSIATTPLDGAGIYHITYPVTIGKHKDFYLTGHPNQEVSSISSELSYTMKNHGYPVVDDADTADVIICFHDNKWEPYTVDKLRAVIIDVLVWTDESKQGLLKLANILNTHFIWNIVVYNPKGHHKEVLLKEVLLQSNCAEQINVTTSPKDIVKEIDDSLQRLGLKRDDLL